jgi:hypothetical protein
MSDQHQVRVGLVGCASMKLKRPAPARDLYVSPLFRKASAYAEATCERWFILSAKHGLVDPDEVIEPYDVRLGRATRDPTTDAPPIHAWAARVRTQLAGALAIEAPDISPLLVVLAGAQYEMVVWHSPWPYEAPLRGLGMGQRLAWLNAALAGDS